MSGNNNVEIDRYIEKASPFAQPILRRVRELVHSSRDDIEEALKWRSPTFLVDGKIICGMAAFKEHCVFAFWHQAVQAEIAKENAKVRAALLERGCLTDVAQLPSAKIVAKYVRRSVELYAADVPSLRRAKERKPELEMPADFEAALKKNSRARTHFAAFSPGKRRDYIEWITTAKRTETRLERLETAVEWIAEGKARHWKYETC